MLGAMDEKGEKITTRNGILTQATGFYKKLYGSNHPLNNEYLKGLEEEEKVPTILEMEVEQAIAQLRNNKIPREDRIINECLKWGGKPKERNYHDVQQITHNKEHSHTMED